MYIDLASIMFTRVIGVDVAPEKLEMATKVGADITFNSKDQDLKEVGLTYLSLFTTVIQFIIIVM